MYDHKYIIFTILLNSLSVVPIKYNILMTNHV